MVVTARLFRFPNLGWSTHASSSGIGRCLPEHHDERRKPATYERILQNIAGRKVNIHWVITRPLLERDGYLETMSRFGTLAKKSTMYG